MPVLKSVPKAPRSSVSIYQTDLDYLKEQVAPGETLSDLLSRVIGAWRNVSEGRVTNGESSAGN